LKHQEFFIGLGSSAAPHFQFWLFRIIIITTCILPTVQKHNMECTKKRDKNDYGKSMNKLYMTNQA